MGGKRLPALDTYILDGKGKPVPERDAAFWAEWYGIPKNRIVKQDTAGRGVLVSTVFLGIDRNVLRRGPPVLWETMILGGRNDGYCRRFASRKEALAGHGNAVEIAKPRSKRR